MKKTALSIFAAWLVLGGIWFGWKWFVSSAKTPSSVSSSQVIKAKPVPQIPQKASFNHPIRVWLLADQNRSTIRLKVLDRVSFVVNQDTTQLADQDLGTLQPQSELTIVARGGEVIAENADKSISFKAPRLTFWASQEGAHEIASQGNEVRSYLGKMTFVPNGSTLNIMNELDLDDYVASVVAGEMPFEELEAVKAQAIAARTYALRFADYIDDTTDSQVYYGKGAETAISRQAAMETSGRVVTYNGELITAYFSASNGGHTTTNVGSIGQVNLPYIQSFPDPYDKSNPLSGWSSSLSRAAVHQHLSGSFGFKVDTIAWVSFRGDGRARYVGLSSINKTITTIPAQAAKEIEVEEDVPVTSALSDSLATDKAPVIKKKRKVLVQPAIAAQTKVSKSVVPHTVSNAKMRIAINALKPNALKNNNFRIGVSGGSYIFSGSGAGHGAGMSQYGAREMARQGKKCEEILTYYYRGVKLAQLPKNMVVTITAQRG